MKTKVKSKKASTGTPATSITGTSKKVSTSKLSGLVGKKQAENPPATEGKKEKKDRTLSTRATNYNFPKDATDPKSRKKFRTSVRKMIASFQDRLAEAKAGKSKESEKTVLKELGAYKAEVYLNEKAAE